MRTILKALVVAGTVIMPTTSIAALAYMSGNELVKYMRAIDEKEEVKATLQDSYNAGTYIGYVLGVADAYSGISWCPNKQVIVSQVGGIVMKYLNKYPEYWHAAAEGLVLDALKEAFPCK